MATFPPEIAAFLDQLAANPRPLQTAEVVREEGPKLLETEELPPVGEIRNEVIEGRNGPIPIRIYMPLEAPHRYAPVLLYFHGGGWVWGKPEDFEFLARSLVNCSNCALISVDYRLAPEHRFPQGLNDCYDATAWVCEHARELDCDPQRVGVSGSSSGGNLAAAVALMARDEGGPDLCCQLLIYPVTQWKLDPQNYSHCADQHFLTREKMEWYWQHYLPESDVDLRYASILSHPDLSNLPPAIVVLAEHDPLMPEGRAYAKRLHESGTRVYEQIYSRMIHGFLELPLEKKQTALAMENMGFALKKILLP